MFGIPTPALQVMGINRGNLVTVGWLAAGVCRLPTDPIGNFLLTLTNVIVGSRVHIEQLSDGSVFYDAIAPETTLLLTLNAYASGNSNNSLLVKVRNASATPSFRPYETQATAIVGSSAIYVSQIPDE